MGILKNLFGQDPLRFEQKGDSLFADSEWGRAKLEYEKSLSQLEKTSSDDPLSEARVQDKLIQAKEALAREHKQTGEDLMETAHYDDAKEFFQLVLSLTQNMALKSTAENRLEEIEGLAAGDIERILSEPGLDGAENPDEGGETDDDYFVALCSTLPEEVRAAYFSYGESFKSGYAALNRGEFELAASCLSRAMEENPSPDSYIPLELAAARLNLEEIDEAHRLLEAFLQYHPDALPGYQLLCEIFWETGAFDQAEALLDSCPDEVRDSLAYHLLRGETLLKAGNHRDAVLLYQNLMEEHGWNETVARALAGALEALGDFGKARDRYGEIMDQCQSCHRRLDPFIKRKYADISFDMGEHSSAVLEMYLSLAQEDPANANLYYQRVSRIFASMGNKEEARRFEQIAGRYL